MENFIFCEIKIVFRTLSNTYDVAFEKLVKD